MMRYLMTVGVASSGCLLVLGLLASCTIVGLGLGVHWVLIGAIGIVAFSLARKIVR